MTTKTAQPSQKMTNLCVAAILFKESLSEVPDDRKSYGLMAEVELLETALEDSNCFAVLTHAKHIADACLLWDPPPTGFSLRVFRILQLALADYGIGSFPLDEIEKNRNLLWTYLDAASEKS